MKLNAIIVGLFLGFASFCASADEATFTKAGALIKEGKPADAFELLEPLEAGLAGDPNYDYLLATAALQAGNPSRATFIYERILAINPNYIGVRADMGRAYFQMGDLGRAKLEFETIIQLTNLPPDLRTAVESYLAAVNKMEADKRRIITAYVEFGFGRDTNVMGQTSATSIGLIDGSSFALAATDRKRPDNYMSHAMGAELTQVIDEGLSFYVGGDLRGRAYRRIDAADNESLDVRTGIQYSSGAHLFRGGLSQGRYFLDNTDIRDTTGVNLDWRYLANASNQLSMNGSVQALRYIPAAQKTEDYDLYSLTLGWTHVLAPTTVAVLNLTSGAEEAKSTRLDGDKDFAGVRATVQHSLNASLGAFLTTGRQWGDYTRFNTLYGVSRKDILTDATVGLVWSLPNRWSIRPLLSFTRNRSNAEIYTYTRHDASVSVRKDF
jgi:tetratricopeptide (TPR) repeat protein